MEEIGKNLVGKIIKRIYLNECYLKFETDDGDFTYRAKADYWSKSYFYDFYGVKNLLGKKVIEVKEVNLKATDIVKDKGYKKDKKGEDEDIKVYGYQLTTESSGFGLVTSVFSFRNYSNGYYGGFLKKVKNKSIFPEITDDVQITLQHHPKMNI